MFRRFQFSLTWLVIAMLVFGAFFGGVSVGRRCHELENLRAKEELTNEKERLARMQLSIDDSADMDNFCQW